MSFLKRALGLQDPHNPLEKPAQNCLETDPTVLDWLDDVCPSKAHLLEYFAGLFPFFKWIGHYNLHWFFGDLIAGITVGAVVVPQSMGYAKLAGLPVNYGLYTSFTGGIVYWLFATSKDITIGPVAVFSIIVGTIVTDVQSIYPGISGPQIAMTISIICGSIITFMGLVRLGFILDFIPLPSITSFMTGSAITIISGQIKTLLGETANISTGNPAYRILIDSLQNLPSAQRYDAAMGIAALVILYAVRGACNYSVQKYPRRAKLIFFLGALRTSFVILLFTIISAIVNAHREENPVFSIVGSVPRGFDKAGIPKLNGDVVKVVLPKLPAGVIILLLEHIATSKSLSRINNYTIHTSQELIAIGVTNLLSPFVGGYSATGAFSRSIIQSKSGVRSPLAGLITSTVVLIAVYALTTVLCYIPHASLSAVIIHAVGDLIVAPNTVYQFWLISPIDAIIFAVGLLVAITNTIPNSIYITVCISMAVLLFRTAKAPGNFLVRAWIHEKDHQRRSLFLPIDDADNTTQGIKFENTRPGVFIYRFSEGFNYPNAGHYFDTLVQAILKSTRRTNSQAYAKKGDYAWNDPYPGHQANDSEAVLRAIILDFSAVNNVDVTSIQNLIDVRKQLNIRAAPLEVQWHFAHIRNRWTKRALAAAGFGYPSSCAMTPVTEGEGVDSVNPNDPGAPADVEKGKEPASWREQDRQVESWENSLHNNTHPEAIENGSRPFFHSDLASALESVNAYVAANPAL